MRLIFLIITAIAFCLLPIACKTKQLRIEKSEEQKKEVRKSKKDSVFEQKTASKTTVFQADSSQVFELDLETADSIGGKELTFEHIRSPNSEKIIVRGGKVKLKVGSTDRQLHRQKDTLQVNSASVRTSENTQKITESQSFKKEKEVKTQGLTFGGYLSLILWILVLGTLVFLAWRLKLFRKITAIIIKFKRFLNKI